MPKHALAPTREKPPGVVDSSEPASSKVILSNEVLLRSKIAQLEGKHSKKDTKKPSATPTGGGGGSGGGGGKSTRKGTSKRMPEVASGCRPGNGVGGEPRATAQPESENDILGRFEEKLAELKASDAPDTEDSPAGIQEGTKRRHRFSSKGMQALRDLYREQMRTARTMNKHADILTRKTRDLAASNQVMRTESNNCAHEAARLELAAAKLHSLSVELDERHSKVLKSRKDAAAEELKKREEMNASLNTMVSEISTTIKQQEEDRNAQDTENANLHKELQELVGGYDADAKVFSESREAQKREIVALETRLEASKDAVKQALEVQEGLRKNLEEVVAKEDVLRRRVGEHASRLKKLEAGLKTRLESIQQMQIEEARLSVSVARLSKEKSTALSRLGPGIADGANGDGEEGGGTGDTDSSAGEERLMALVRENRERTAELERDKDRIQARCRELQMERKAISAEVEALAASAAEVPEDAPSSCSGESPLPECSS